MNTRTEILNTAKQYTTVDRASTHGGAEDSFRTIAGMWTTYLGAPVSEADVCAMMVLLKIARIKGNPEHTDSWVDVAGYAALGGEIAAPKAKP